MMHLYYENTASVFLRFCNTDSLKSVSFCSLYCSTNLKNFKFKMQKIEAKSDFLFSKLVKQLRN